MNVLPSINRSILFIIAITPVLMSGYCGLPDYGTAHSTNETTYLTKPAYIDTTSNAIYVSGSFSHTLRPYYEKDRIYFGEINLHRSHTWKYVNLSYGILGYGGSYKIDHIEAYRGNKYFGGAGATGEFNVNIPFKKVDLRFIGVRMTWFYENGRYASFREMAERDSLIENVNPGNKQFNISVSFDVIAKLDKANFGLYVSMGKTLRNGEGSITIVSVAHVTHKRLTYFAQCAIGEWQGSSVSAGITYRIHHKTTANTLAKKIMRE